MTRAIAVLNQKGGVGKTTLTANIGHALALAGQRVTIVDLDPQGHLTASFNLRGVEKGMSSLLLHGLACEEIAVAVRDKLLLLPANSDLRDVENLSENRAECASVLRKALFSCASDYVLVDCPPASNVLIGSALVACDEVLTPVTGDYLALHGLSNLLRTLNHVQRKLNHSLHRWIVLSRLSLRRRLSREVITKLTGYFPRMILPTAIREAALLAECPGYGKTVFELRANSASALELRQLADDLSMRRTL